MMNHYARVGFAVKGDFSRTVGANPRYYKASKCMPDKIRDAVSHVYGMNLEHIKSRSRKLEIKEFKHCVRYFLKTYTTQSLKQIGTQNGGFDHSSVINSIGWYKDSLLLNDDRSKAIQKNHKKILEILGLSDKE